MISRSGTGLISEEISKTAICFSYGHACGGCTSIKPRQIASTGIAIDEKMDQFLIARMICRGISRSFNHKPDETIVFRYRMKKALIEAKTKTGTKMKLKL